MKDIMQLGAPKFQIKKYILNDTKPAF